MMLDEIDEIDRKSVDSLARDFLKRMSINTTDETMILRSRALFVKLKLLGADSIITFQSLNENAQFDLMNHFRNIRSETLLSLINIAKVLRLKEIDSGLSILLSTSFDDSDYLLNFKQLIVKTAELEQRQADKRTYASIILLLPLMYDKDDIIELMQTIVEESLYVSPTSFINLLENWPTAKEYPLNWAIEFAESKLSESKRKEGS